MPIQLSLGATPQLFSTAPAGSLLYLPFDKYCRLVLKVSVPVGDKPTPFLIWLDEITDQEEPKKYTSSEADTFRSDVGLNVSAKLVASTFSATKLMGDDLKAGDIVLQENDALLFCKPSRPPHGFRGYVNFRTGLWQQPNEKLPGLQLRNWRLERLINTEDETKVDIISENS